MGGFVRQPGWFRLMRSGVFASVCVVLSVVGHDLMASGRTPLWAGFAALGVLVPVGYSLAGRRRSALGLLLAVEAVQFGLHGLFSWATPAAPMAGMVSHSSSGAGMFGVHALAGALVAGWLHVGDRALWWALSVLVEPVRRACAVLFFWCSGLAVWLVVGGFHRDREVGPLAVLRHVVARRGPPAVGFALASP